MNVTTLRQMVLVDLQAWCESGQDVAFLADRIVDQLESGYRRADCKLPAGVLAWEVDEQERVLRAAYPSGALRTRPLPDKSATHVS